MKTGANIHHPKTCVGCALASSGMGAPRRRRQASKPTQAGTAAITAMASQAVVGPIQGSAVATQAVNKVPRPIPVKVTPLTRARCAGPTAVNAVLTPRTISQAPVMPATNRQPLIQFTPHGRAQATKLSTVNISADTTSGRCGIRGATSARTAPRQ